MHDIFTMTGPCFPFSCLTTSFHIRIFSSASQDIIIQMWSVSDEDGIMAGQPRRRRSNFLPVAISGPALSEAGGLIELLLCSEQIIGRHRLTSGKNLIGNPKWKNPHPGLCGAKNRKDNGRSVASSGGRLFKARRHSGSFDRA